MPTVEQRAVSMYAFKEVSRPSHITIADVLAFPVGEPQKLFCMDRNVEDFCRRCDHRVDRTQEDFVRCDCDLTDGPPLPPSIFFANCYFVEFTREQEDSIRGTWRFNSSPGETDRRELEVDLSGSALKPNGDPCSIFWTPLVHGCVPRRADIGGYRIGEHAGKGWRALDPSTRLGWRGPMMRVADMDKYPNVFYPRQGVYE